MINGVSHLGTINWNIREQIMIAQFEADFKKNQKKQVARFAGMVLSSLAFAALVSWVPFLTHALLLKTFS